MKFTFVLTIIILIILFYFLNDKKLNVKTEKDQINKNLFNILSVIFLIIFIVYGYKKGVKYGSSVALFIWAFLVCAVPVPEVALLLAFPLKHFFSIKMSFSQLIISIFAICVLLFYYFVDRHMIKTIQIGKIFLKLMKEQLYSIFIISIVASIIGSHLLDIFIDYFVFKTKDKTNLNYRNSIFFILIFVLLNLWYIKIASNNKIFI